MDYAVIIAISILAFLLGFFLKKESEEELDEYDELECDCEYREYKEGVKLSDN